MGSRFVAAALGAAFVSPCFAIEPSALVGIWRLEKENLVAKAAMYTEFAGDGRCRQVAKAKIVGTTHWITDQCTWKLDGATLTMKVTASATHPDKVGSDATTSTVDSVSAAEMVISTQDGDPQAWARVDVIPPEYAEKLAAEVAK